MARTRYLKPGFFTNDLLAEVPPLGRLLFAGLWCHADRAGRLAYRPKKFKAEILPYDDCDVEGLIDVLASKGFLLRYEVGQDVYIQIVNFTRHQHLHRDERESTLPAPMLHPGGTVVAPLSQGASGEKPHGEHPCSTPFNLNLNLELEPPTRSGELESAAVAVESVPAETAVAPRGAISHEFPGMTNQDRQQRLQVLKDQAQNLLKKGNGKSNPVLYQPKAVQA